MLHGSQNTTSPFPPRCSTVPSPPIRTGSPLPQAMRQRNSAIFGRGLQSSSASKTFSERRRSSVLVGQRSVDLLMEQPGEPMPRFAIFIIRCYRRWGYFIAEHDWQAMAICIFISIIGLYFVLTTPQQNDITGYSPFGARARIEYSRFQEFFSHDGPGIALYIFTLANDGGSMIREAYLKEAVDILKLASENVTMLDFRHNKERNFNQFCRSFCKINEPVRVFYEGLKLQTQNQSSDQLPSSRIKLDYPKAQIIGYSFSLQQSFFGVEFYNDTEGNSGGISELTDTGRTNKNNSEFDDALPIERVTNMRKVKMVVLQFLAEHEPGWTNEIVKSYEMAMVKRFEQDYKSERLNIYVLANSYVEEEMVRAGISMLPYLTVGLLVMVACSVFFVLMRAMYMHQHTPPKIFLAIATCFLPFMSCATALGFMFLFGMRFASILCVIPFLVLSIGVDSSYLMNHEWQRVIKHCRQQPNRKNCNVGYRISQVLSEVGPAILISMLTNVFADGMGAYTSSPEIMLLCVGNMISMLVAFIFQMTFYAGLMSLVGRYEITIENRERRELHESIRKSVYVDSSRSSNMELSNGMLRKHPALTRQQSKFHEHTKHYISKSILFYVNVIANRVAAILTIILYFVYIGFSIWGITRININLTTQKLFTEDSRLLELDKLRVRYQLTEFMMARIIIFAPGNLSDPKRLDKMNSFVADMEHLNGTWGTSKGPDGTQYFVRDFLTFEATSSGGDIDPEQQDDLITATTGVRFTSLFREEDLIPFLQWPPYSWWSGFLKMDNETGRLERFFFTTSYHGEKLSIWTERGKLLKEWRTVVDKYKSEFDASVFHEDAVFLDLIDNMPTDTWQSVLGTLICMAFVCFAFLNSLFTVVFASCCVLSICCGILGILSWLSIDLDPITMAAMIISIGFSVDIPAHVSYHYYQASIRELDATPQMKLVNCLSSVAFPALQAAVSTTLCVCSLLFVHLYMAEVFVKTMVLCVLLCNLHGLLFLPAFLIVFDPVVQSFHQYVLRRAQISNKIQGGDSHIRPNTIPEESSSHESSIHENKCGQKGKLTQKLNGMPSVVEQSHITDRPQLERFHSVELDADHQNKIGNEGESC